MDRRVTIRAVLFCAALVGAACGVDDSDEEVASEALRRCQSGVACQPANPCKTGTVSCVNRTPVVTRVSMRRDEDERTRYWVFNAGLNFTFPAGRKSAGEYRVVLQKPGYGAKFSRVTVPAAEPHHFRLLSDGLLSTMSQRQVEAVFGHEAGHARRHHLLYFGVFSILSMLVVGGVLELLIRVFHVGVGPLNIVALGGMLATWRVAFGYLSRKFERGARSSVGGVRLAGERALVTGSTAGIGRAIAVEFAAQGASVVVTGRDHARGTAVVDEIQAAAGDAVNPLCPSSASATHRRPYS